MSLESMKIEFGGKELILETGHLARQAGGSVTVRCGGTVVLVTACMSREIKEDRDFFPLTVEYQEKTYAAGRIPGGFFKREGRPSESEILCARLIDRPIRPLFPDGMRNEVQIMAIVLSSDGENDPDVLAVVGASCALMISDIPFPGPVGASRVARVNGELVINPTYAQIEKSDFEMVVAGTKDGVIMLECRAKEIPEEDIIQAIEFGYKNTQVLMKLQEEFSRKYGSKKQEVVLKAIDESLVEKVRGLAVRPLEDIFKISDKEGREDAVSALSKQIEEQLLSDEISAKDIREALTRVEKAQVRDAILVKSVRADSRGLKEVRPIDCKVGLLPRTHGSGLFTRGQTQSLSVTTLGTGEDEQLIEALEGESYKSFMLHYSFPPFSVGETKPVRGPGRREIGHGALAEKALSVMMPSKEAFPYTVRVVSEILESNGSSSMATVCAATLSLMDAGVPLKDAVAGVAMGLIKEKQKAIILTDITGLEDHFGDMDFKVAGTTKGVTALQLDLKIEGISSDILRQAVAQAEEARLFILEKMKQAIAAPRQELSAYAPRITMLKVNPEKIGELIGPGGKNVKKIISQTGVTIDIQDDGTVMVGSTDPKRSQEAIDIINSITEEAKVGKIYNAKVKRIMNFGAFCEIAPGKEGLVHVSELADTFVKNVEDVVKVGDEIKVKVVNIDELGRINLSKKQADAEAKK
ncbi:MAG: polyribonucleotide nucleotidyltransferase [Candidatus Omnitrophica bacterium]|nr:polyribonucleotide nucleotidyltransferase [Candidatus Omnitrophota bacterium]